MRAIFLLICITPASLNAKDIKTLSGKIYNNVQSTRIEGDKLRVTYAGTAYFSGGSMVIPFSDIPKTSWAEYGYAPKPPQPQPVAASEAPSTPKGETLEVLTGIQYSGITNYKVRINGLQITYADGIKIIPYNDLSPDTRKKHKCEKEVVDAMAQVESAAIEKATKEKAEKTMAWYKSRIKTIREVETDIPSFLGSSVFIIGTIELSTYYNYEYSNAEVTHYAYTVKQDGRRANVYMEKTSEHAQSLRRELLENGGPLRGEFQIFMSENRYSSSAHQIFGELLTASAPPDDSGQSKAARASRQKN